MAKNREPRNIETAPSAKSRAPQQNRNISGLAVGRARRAENVKRTRELKAAGVPKRVDLYRAGELPISEWTNEELQHCRPMNIDGGFSGSPPKLKPKEYDAIKRELLKRGQRMLDSMYHDAIKVLHDIATDGIAPEAARVKAANLIVERVGGKVVERVEIKSSDPWQDILDEVLGDEVLPQVKPGAKKA